MSKLWKAEHIYENDMLEEYIKLIGYFSTRALARAAVKQLKEKSGFKSYPRGFSITQVTLDKVEWCEGFIHWRDA